ncbi:MAG TPA: hypothetical protein VHT52_23145 [Stellaceae bacterium]|jgi:hypothetical protein|nr:hypothetical protein [Stellaceae bacterium]
MPGWQPTGRDDQDLRRLFSAGVNFRAIGLSFSPPRTVREVCDRLRFLGFLGGETDSLPSNALALAKAALRDQVVAARAEMQRAERRPGKL